MRHKCEAYISHSCHTIFKCVLRDYNYFPCLDNLRKSSAQYQWDLTMQDHKEEDEEIKKAGERFLNPDSTGAFLSRPTAPPTLKNKSGKLFTN